MTFSIWTHLLPKECHHGPASVGIIVPDLQIKLGAIGGNDPGISYNGNIAIFSKSGGMCLSLRTRTS